MPSTAGHITVTTAAGTARSRARFTVTPRIVLSTATGPPSTVLTVLGTGFGATERADIFVGATDRAVAATSRTGSFGPVTVAIPAKAGPGIHWISAKGRRTGLLAQHKFTVNTNWAQFRYSATRTGTNPFENVLSASNVTRLGEIWGFRANVFSSPAVANGVVYAETGNVVYALNAATGAKRWSAPVGDFDSSPAVAKGVVYTGSLDGHVYALNAATGAELWNFETGDDVHSSPAVARRTVYINSLLASRGGLVFGTTALNAATGGRRWKFATGAYSSSPAVASGVVYTGGGSNVYALNADTGADLWTFTTGGAVESTPAVAGEVVYIGSDDHNVYALNAATGAKLWTFTTGGAVESSPAVAGGVVYIGSDDHNVYALNAATGAKLWTFTTGARVLSSPAVANGGVYIGSDDGNLYGLNAATGTRLWTLTGRESSPVVANGMVYFGADSVYAFGLPGAGAAPGRPHRASLHPDYNLPQQ